MRIFALAVFALAVIGLKCRARRIDEEDHLSLGKKMSFRPPRFQEEAAGAKVKMRSMTLSPPRRLTRNSWQCLDTVFTISNEVRRTKKSWSAKPECFSDPRSPMIDTTFLHQVTVLVRSTRTEEPEGLFAFFQSPSPAPSPLESLSLKCENTETSQRIEVDVGAALPDQISPETTRVNIPSPKLKTTFSREITTGRRTAGNPIHVTCELEATGSEIIGSIQFRSSDRASAFDMGLKEPTWLGQISEGDTNVGFEFESYFLQLAMENAGETTFDTKEVAFSGFGFDLTADVKQEGKGRDLFTWYDVEAVTQPFGSDGGVQFCKMSMDIREIYGDIHKKITKDLVDRTVAAAGRCAVAEDKKECFDTERGALQATVRERDIEFDHVAAAKTVKAKALFPSPILLGVGTKNDENTEETLRIVEKYGVLARPQATFCVHVDRMLDFFMEPTQSEGGDVSYKMRKERFMYAAFNNIANIDSAPRDYKTWRTRTERVMGRVMAFSPSQSNVLTFDIDGMERSVTFGPSHDAIKGFIFVLRMILMRLHHPERKGLYTKARMSTMIRTNTVTWWETIKDDAPSGLDEDVFEALVCDGVEGLYIKHGWGFDVKTKKYFTLNSRAHKTELTVHVTESKKDDYTAIYKALKSAGIVQAKKLLGKPEGSTLTVKTTTVEGENALGLTVIVNDSEGDYDLTATLETIDVVKETLSRAFPCEVSPSVPQQGLCYPILERDDDEIETADTSHSGSCSDWVRGIVGHAGIDSIAESLKTDLSYGYITEMDPLRDLKSPGDEIEEDAVLSTSAKGVRFEMRGLLSIIGPSSAKGVTVDEFLLEAAELTRFGAWLNDPSPRRAAERQAGIEPPNNLHSFWYTGHVRKNLQHPTQLQLEYPDHAIFNEPGGKVDDELRRRRAKAAAELIFESEDNCQKYFAGGGLRVKLTRENVAALGLSSAKLTDIMQERCVGVSGSNIELPSGFGDMQEDSRVFALVRAIEDCELAKKSGGVAAVVAKMEERLEVALVDWIESVRAEADRTREQFKTETLPGVRHALDTAESTSKAALASLILKYASSSPLSKNGHQSAGAI